MLEGALEQLLLQYLAPYVEGIVRENLRLGVFSGSLELKDLKVKPEALSLLGLDGFRVGTGTVHLISLRIPLKDLYRGKVQVIIDSVQMHVKSVIEEGKEQEDDATLKAMRKDKEDSIALRVKQYEEAAKQQTELDAKPGFAMKLVRKIINNIKVQIMNVKLVLSSTQGMAGSVEFKGLHILSTDSGFNELDEVVLEKSMYKLARLEDLCLRMSLAGSNDLDSTEYLLTPVSGEVKLAHELDDPTNQMLKVRIEVATTNLAGISLLRSQVKHLRSIMNDHSAEKQRLHLKRISPDDEKSILEHLEDSKAEYSRLYERHLLVDWKLSGEDEQPLSDSDRLRVSLLEDALSIWLLSHLRYAVLSKVQALNEEVVRRKRKAEAQRIEEERAKAGFFSRNFGRWGSSPAGTGTSDSENTQWISAEEREQLLNDIDDESKVETVDVPTRFNLEIALGRICLDLVDDRTEVKEKRQLLNLMMTALELGVAVQTARDYAGNESAEWKVNLHLNGFNAKHATKPIFDFDAPSRRNFLSFSEEEAVESFKTTSTTSTFIAKHAAEFVIAYKLEQDCNLLKIHLDFQPMMINCLPGAVDQLLEFVQPPDSSAAVPSKAPAVNRYQEYAERTVQMLEENKERVEEVRAKLFQLIPDKIDLNLRILSPILMVPIPSLGTAKFSLGGLTLRTTKPAEVSSMNLSLDLNDTVLRADSDRGESFDMIQPVPVHVDIELKNSDDAMNVKIGVEVQKVTAMLAPQALSILLATPMQLASFVSPQDAVVPPSQDAVDPPQEVQTDTSWTVAMERVKKAAKEIGSDESTQGVWEDIKERVQVQQQKQVSCDVSVQVNSANLTLADSIVPVMQIKGDMAPPGLVVYFQKTPNMLNIEMDNLMLDWDIFNPRNGTWEPLVEHFSFGIQMESKTVQADVRKTEMVVSGHKPLLLNLTPSAVKRAAFILPQFLESLTASQALEASSGEVDKVVSDKYRVLNLSQSPIVLDFKKEDSPEMALNMEVKPTGSEWISLDDNVLPHFVKALTCAVSGMQPSQSMLLERAGAMSIPGSGLIAELVTPDPSHRMLLLGSPIRLHNQTDLHLVIRFHNAATREAFKSVCDEASVCDGALLGYAQPENVHSQYSVDEAALHKDGDSLVMPPNSTCAVPAKVLAGAANGSKTAMISAKPAQCGVGFCNELEVNPGMQPMSVVCRGEPMPGMGRAPDMYLVCESRYYDGNGISSEDEVVLSSSTITVVSFRPPLSLLNALPLGATHVGFVGVRDDSASAQEIPFDDRNAQTVPCFRRLNIYGFPGMLRQGLAVRIRLAEGDTWSKAVYFSSEAFKDSEATSAKESESMKTLQLRQRADGAPAGVAVEPISACEVRFSCPHWFVDRSGLNRRLHQLELQHKGSTLPCGRGPGCKGLITLLPENCQEEPVELVLRSQGPSCKSNLLFPPNWSVLPMKTPSNPFIFCVQTEDVAKIDVLGAQCQVMTLKPMLVFTNSSDCILEVRTSAGTLRLKAGESIEHHWEVRRGEEDSTGTTCTFRPAREGLPWSDDVICSATQAGSTPFLFTAAGSLEIWSVVVAPARGELAVTFQRGSNFAAKHDAKRSQVSMAIRPAGGEDWGKDDIPVECGTMVDYGWPQPFKDSRAPRAVDLILNDRKYYIDDVRRHQWDACPQVAQLGVLVHLTHEGAKTVLHLVDRDVTSSSSAGRAQEAAASGTSAASAQPSSSFKVELKLSRAGISLVREAPRPGELLYMQFELIRLEFLQTGSGLQELALIVSDCQIDCQLRERSDAMTRKRQGRDEKPAVIVANGADGDLSFLKLGVRRLVTANRTMLLPSVEIVLDTFDISVDDDWLKPLFEFVQSSIPGKSLMSGVRFSSIAETASVPVTEGFIAPPLPLVLQVDSFKISDIKLVVWAAIKLKSMKFLPQYLRNIIRVLSVSDLLKLEGANLNLQKKNLPPQRGSALDFAQALKTEYQENVLKNLASVLGKSSLLNVPRAPVKLGGAALSHLSESVGLAIGEGASVLNTLTMDEEYQRKQQAIRDHKKIGDFGDGVVEAGKSLAQGVVGLGDVFRKPVEGAKEGGIGGFFGGLGKGLVGSVVKPVSALGQAFQDVSSGVSASVSPDTQQMKKRRDRKRTRKPRLLFTELGAIRSYDELEARAGEQLGPSFLRGLAEVVPLTSDLEDDCEVLLLFPERLIMAAIMPTQTSDGGKSSREARVERGNTSSSIMAKDYKKTEFAEATEQAFKKVVTQSFKPMDAMMSGGRRSQDTPATSSGQGRSRSREDPYNIKICGGVAGGRSVLSTSHDGNVDLWYHDDGSGRQQWTIIKGSDSWYHIKIVGGTFFNRAYLSAKADGSNVELASSDDSSGRQRWVISKGTGDWYTIQVSQGVTGRCTYLSSTPDGCNVNLSSSDDRSGRQRWELPGFTRETEFKDLVGVSCENFNLELILKNGSVVPLDLRDSPLGEGARKALVKAFEYTAAHSSKVANWEQLRAVREDEDRQASKSASMEEADVSLLSTGAGQRILEVFELERYRHLTNTWETAFLPTDRESSYRWVDAAGHRHPHLKVDPKTGKQFTREWYVKQQRPPCELAKLFKEASDWKLDVNANTDEKGWRYALAWNSSTWDNHPAMFDSVRKRRWTKAYV